MRRAVVVFAFLLLLWGGRAHTLYTCQCETCQYTGHDGAVATVARGVSLSSAVVLRVAEVCQWQSGELVCSGCWAREDIGWNVWNWVFGG